MDIKVGEYIRTNKGNIGKIVKEYTFKNGVVYPEPQEWVLDNGYVLNETVMYQMGEKIVNHSNNIIDLIEVGDLIEFILNENTGATEIMQITYEEQLTLLKENLNEHYPFKSILTKEQFDREKYIVGK